MLFSLYFYTSWIFYLWINSTFWGISNPLSHKYFIFLWKEIWSLALSHIIYPMTLEMVSATFSQNTISTSLSLKPHTWISNKITLINITVFKDHSTLSMRQIIHPHSIISIADFVKHSSSSLLLIILPITSILPSKFIFGIRYPISTLSMSFILFPTTLILISISIILYPKSMFFII